MRTEKQHQLTEVHLLHRIWRNELELSLQEVNFWEDLLGTLGEGLEPGATDADTWRVEIDRLHHFRRLSTRLLSDTQIVDGEVADGVLKGHVLDRDTRLDHQYLRKEMDSFHAEFRAFKTEIRQYMVAQPTF
ncbi:MAG: hypothetical protein H7Z72_22880 [Bacteroidetes bacterium]|nr:hypothetical protein [Fibrella sp.]